MEEYKEVKLRDTGCKNETRKELAEDRVKQQTQILTALKLPALLPQFQLVSQLVRNFKIKFLFNKNKKSDEDGIYKKCSNYGTRKKTPPAVTQRSVIPCSLKRRPHIQQILLFYFFILYCCKFYHLSHHILYFHTIVNKKKR